MKLNFYQKLRADRLAQLLIFALVWGSISGIFAPQRADAAAGQGIYTTAGETSFHGSAGVVVDPDLTINYTDNSGILPGANVVISNFVPGDSLSVDTVAASTYGINVTNSSSSNGVLALAGNTSADNYQALLRTVKFSTSSSDESDRNITFAIGSALPFNGNGHFYEFVSGSGITWTAARTAAESRSYFGRQGYLVTITTAAENDFVAQKAQATGWIGAQDIGRKSGESRTASNDPGDWRWVSGPEGLEDGGNGLQFYSGYVQTSGSAVNGMYANWAAGEPNDYSGVEYVAHIYASGTNAGKWNDFSPTNDTALGYLVEYGGMPTDDTSTQVISSKTIRKEAGFVSSTWSSSDSGATITLTFDNNVELSSIVTDSTYGFTVEIDGQPVVLQAVSASGNTVTLTLPEGISPLGNKVTVAYDSGSGGLQSTSGAPVDSFNATLYDKASLRAAAADGSALNPGDYTGASWTPFENALDNANNVLADPNATQQDVDDALAALNAAKNSLVDKTAAEQLVKLELTANTSAVALTPVFSPGVYKYNATVTNDTDNVSVAPIAASNDTVVKVTLNGVPVDTADWNSLPLAEGRNVIKTGVYSNDGTLLKEYEIEIIRTTNKLSNLVSSIGSLSPDFGSNTMDYSLYAGSSSEIQLKPTALDPNAKIEISVNGGNWKGTASGDFSANLPLDVGVNTIIVRVTDIEGNVKSYKIQVTRATGNIYVPGPATAPESGVKTTVNGTDGGFAAATTADNLTTVTIDKNKLSDYITKGNKQQLNVIVPGDGNIKITGLTVAALKQLADTGSTLNVENLLAVYPVPSKQLDLSSVTKQWSGAPLGEIAVDIEIKPSPEALKAAAEDQAAKGGYELLVKPVDLSLSFTYKDQTVKPDHLTGYAPRYIALPEGADPNKITTGVVVNQDGTVFHLPTVVTKMNNRYFALINDLRSQGSYSVIWNPQDFSDVKSHWAQKSVNNIAARLMLKGTGNNTFSPNRSIERSEFGAIVASGLGLMRQEVTDTPYSDIARSVWYHDAVSIASEFGIIKGYDDGAFHGNRLITREQGIAMIARSLHLIEPQAKLSESEINQILSSYRDMSEISGYARESAALLIKAGILQGKGGQLLKPKAEMTRAETAALIERLLKNTQLID